MVKGNSLVVLAFVAAAMSGLVASRAEATPVYDTSGSYGGDILWTVQYSGAPPEDSVQDFRWYWSYADRFEIQFEKTQWCLDIADGSDWVALQNALDTWEAVAGSSLANSLHGYDGDWAWANRENEVGWITNGWTTMFGGAFSPGAIGVTVTAWDPDTMVQLESDVFFNWQYFYWYTHTDDNGPADSMYIEQIALHELGHAFSLDDLYGGADTARTMYGYTGYRNEDVTLDAGDEAALSFAYPNVPAPGAVLLGFLGVGLVSATRRLRSAK